ncbi:MAG: diaminopimelate decarboxylase [Anaerolineae bacterium]|nr:diaminopimelate decarboxylase [Anaerolineae bacterium]
MEARLELFPESVAVKTTGAGGELTLDGLSLATLAERYGTPLYLYDAATLDAAVNAYARALARCYPGEAGITYAGKAFFRLALAQWTQRHALWVDCTGAGELAVAQAASVPREHILLHGVNKSTALLATAVKGVGTIVVDNLTELGRLAALAEEGNALPALWLRFKPGRAVETHSHIQTGHDESKFGMGWDEIVAAAALCREQGLPLAGLHFHLGSQFRDPDPIEYALERTLDLAAAVELPESWTLSPGGGLGVAYHEEQLPHPDPEAYVCLVAERIVAGCGARGLALPRLQFEPGRSLVARAGVAVYRVGALKQAGARRWLLLDGGMADNPRFALYGARYSALPVRAPLRPASGAAATFAGPYCESGDVLIEELPFAEVEAGEFVAIPLSGAYHLSMASNYNGALRPAVLWLEDGKATLIQARETPADLLRRDRPLPEVEVPLARVPLRKYHVNGNDYILASLADLRRVPEAEEIRQLCDRHRGFGSDGLLLDTSTPEDGFSLRIFNPDGSEAEKSGNGLSMFTRYLWETGRTGSEPAAISTKGGLVTACYEPDGRRVTLQIGRARFSAGGGELAPETMTLDGQSFRYCAVDLGNPHCVVLRDELSEAETRRWGPLFENAPRFPQRTNVQFMVVRDRANIAIEIWERGAGYTLASGSSSSAAAAVAHALGLCDETVRVHTPGGSVTVAIDAGGEIILTTTVTKVWQGYLSSG